MSHETKQTIGVLYAGGIIGDNLFPNIDASDHGHGGEDNHDDEDDHHDEMNELMDDHHDNDDDHHE